MCYVWTSLHESLLEAAAASDNKRISSVFSAGVGSKNRTSHLFPPYEWLKDLNAFVYYMSSTNTTGFRAGG